MRARVYSLATLILALVLAGAGPVFAQSDEPTLPAGLAPPAPATPSVPDPEEPALPDLPAGLPPAAAPTPESSEPALPDLPALPEGLGTAEATTSAPTAEASPRLPFDLTGFLEGRAGARIVSDPVSRGASIAESRLQLEIEDEVGGVTLHVTSDFILDALAPETPVHLGRGDGFVDLRTASLAFSPAGFADIKLGRQILTWGTGDLLFINDLFPKDWNAFFIGRDEEYLKAPSDAVKLSLFSDLANLDIVYTPRFDADRYIDGRRLSFFDPSRGRLVGRDAGIRTLRPGGRFKGDEWALRLYRNFGAYEAAVYGYVGFWKSPAGVDPIIGRLTFPRLSVIGASLRGPLGPGIANVEAGLYRSSDDPHGNNPLIRNGEVRLLVGYEQEIARNLTLGLQYYIERLTDFARFRAALPLGAPGQKRSHQLITQRLTWLTLNQNLTWSLFVFFSPTDTDAYLRPKLSYKLNDHLTVEAGGNLIFGKTAQSFFGQLQDNTNLYAALRYSF